MSTPKRLRATSIPDPRSRNVAGPTTDCRQSEHRHHQATGAGRADRVPADRADLLLGRVVQVQECSIMADKTCWMTGKQHSICLPATSKTSIPTCSILWACSVCTNLCHQVDECSFNQTVTAPGCGRGWAPHHSPVSSCSQTRRPPSDRSAYITAGNSATVSCRSIGVLVSNWFLSRTAVLSVCRPTARSERLSTKVATNLTWNSWGRDHKTKYRQCSEALTGTCNYSCS